MDTMPSQLGRSWQPETMGLFTRTAAQNPTYGSSQGGSIAAHSLYRAPISPGHGVLRGNSREWADAPDQVKLQVITLILNATQGMTTDDRAFLLATAYVESGFNPDAAAKTSSAAGVFQVVSANWRKLAQSGKSPFEAKENIAVALELNRQNQLILAQRYPSLRGDQRAAMLYALFHDGPSLAHGGLNLAEERVVPLLPLMREVVKAQQPG